MPINWVKAKGVIFFTWRAWAIAYSAHLRDTKLAELDKEFADLNINEEKARRRAAGGFFSEYVDEKLTTEEDIRERWDELKTDWTEKKEELAARHRQEATELAARHREEKHALDKEIKEERTEFRKWRDTERADYKEKRLRLDADWKTTGRGEVLPEVSRHFASQRKELKRKRDVINDDADQQTKKIADQLKAEGFGWKDKVPEEYWPPGWTWQELQSKESEEPAADAGGPLLANIPNSIRFDSSLMRSLQFRARLPKEEVAAIAKVHKLTREQVLDIHKQLRAAGTTTTTTTVKDKSEEE